VGQLRARLDQQNLQDQPAHPYSVLYSPLLHPYYSILLRWSDLPYPLVSGRVLYSKEVLQFGFKTNHVWAYLRHDSFP
jgi:hypothetical protein